MDGREVYYRRAVYGNGTGNVMFNDILQSENMPEIMRDVIITVLYKGKGPRDNCEL